ncbi:hypothetical protein B0T19DRAFT_151394 [Cercophora scortea]|uniref:Uncharacterized protein n=1 Tax=Cercophora scortea TaxID=314031 RepID=A0AAE0MC23_9PEZI|nr:hypothetical protein B0T19DRAFT_151394 [Cercophora scortea]
MLHRGYATRTLTTRKTPAKIPTTNGQAGGRTSGEMEQWRSSKLPLPGHLPGLSLAEFSKIGRAIMANLTLPVDCDGKSIQVGKNSIAGSEGWMELGGRAPGQSCGFGSKTPTLLPYMLPVDPSLDFRIHTLHLPFRPHPNLDTHHTFRHPINPARHPLPSLHSHPLHDPTPNQTTYVPCLSQRAETGPSTLMHIVQPPDRLLDVDTLDHPHSIHHIDQASRGH